MLTFVKQLARDNVCIAATVHSPTQCAFELFDALLLLVKGRAAFFGRTAEAVPFAIGAWRGAVEASSTGAEQGGALGSSSAAARDPRRWQQGRIHNEASSLISQWRGGGFLAHAVPPLPVHGINRFGTRRRRAEFCCSRRLAGAPRFAAAAVCSDDDAVPQNICCR